MEGHVKIITMHILMDMEDMVFSLDDLNRVLMEKVDAENRKPFEGLTYSRYDLFTTEEKETLLPLPPSVSQNFLKALNSAAIPLCSLSVRFWNLST